MDIVGLDREVTYNLHQDKNHYNSRITGLLKKLYVAFVHFRLKVFLYHVQYLETRLRYSSGGNFHFILFEQANSG